MSLEEPPDASPAAEALIGHALSESAIGDVAPTLAVENPESHVVQLLVDAVFDQRPIGHGSHETASPEKEPTEHATHAVTPVTFSGV